MKIPAKAWFVSSLVFLGLKVFAADWEAALADYHRARTEAQRIADWAVSARPAPEAVRKRWDFLRNQYPNSAEAAGVEVQRCLELLNADKWRELVEVVPEAAARVATYPSKVAALAAFLSRAAANQNLPAEVRARALRALVPLAAGKAFSVHLCLNFLLADANGLGPAESFKTGLALEEACGASPRMREFRWRLIERYAPGLSPAAGRTEVEAFLERYGAEHAEGWAAVRWLKRLDAADAKAFAAEVAREEKARAAVVKEATRVVSAALEAGDAQALRAALRGGVALPPRALSDAFWSALLGGKTFGAASSEAKGVLLEAVFENSNPGAAQELAVSTVVHHFRGEPKVMRMLLPHFEANASDMQRATTFLNLLIRSAKDSGDGAFVQDAFRLAVGVGTKLGMSDLTVDYLTDYAEQVWDFDLGEAKKALQRAAAAWPRIPAAAEAGWVLEFLEGRNGLVQGAPARRSEPRPAAQPVVLPAVSAGAGEGGHVEGARVKEQGSGRWMPGRLEEKRNLLAGCPATDQAGKVQQGATDGKADTAWVPGAFPSALRIALAEASAVERVTVRLSDPADFVVTLRDASGKALRQVERDWAFWEQFRTSQLWSGTEEVLRVLPVDGVAFVDVQILSSNGEVSVREVECFSPAYPLETLHAFAAQPLEPGARSVKVEFLAEPVAHSYTLEADREYTRGYPIHRWAAPWARSKKPLLLRSVREHFAVEFFGSKAEVLLTGSGGVRWNLDDVSFGEEAAVHVKTPTQRTVELPGGRGGRHLLKLEETRFAAAQNFGGWADMRFEGLRVHGEARVQPVVRFVGEGGAVSPWLQAGEGAGLAVPAEVGGAPVKALQSGLFFDNRDVAGQTSASAPAPRIVFAKASAAPGRPLREDARREGPEEFFPEQKEAVLAELAKRRAVVTYPKVGTQQEFEAARRIAEHAGLYLAPDDVGLNQYSAPVLAVGTPLRHRYCRQLLATAGLWNSGAFLNNPAGVIGVERDEQGGASLFHVTGETPAAVVAAAERLLAALPRFTPAPDRPFRVFAMEGLEVAYPWQLHADRPAPAPALVLGVNDRRSVQFGVSADVDLKDIRVECDALRSASGATLPAVLVRRVGNYEWIPFFGDLRLPNHLLGVEGFELPANAAAGVWLTVLSAPDAAPGEYSGQVRVSAGGRKLSFPLRVRVAPVPLPDFTEAATFSFASVPYWFHGGSALWRKAVAALAADEADQRVSHLGPVLRYKLEEGRFTRPARIGIGARAAAPEVVQWRPMDAEENAPGGEQAVFVKFEREVGLREVALALRPAERAAFRLAVWEQGAWREVGPVSRSLSPSFQVHARKVEAGAEVIRLKTSEDGAPVRGQVWRVSAPEGVAFSQRGCVAVAEGDDPWPLRMDFRELDEELAIGEAVYREKGLAAPHFLPHMASAPLTQAAVRLFGTNQLREGDVCAWFAEQLAAHLRKAGRESRFILKVGDEPASLELWAQSAQPYRDGGLRIMTCHNASYPDMNVGNGLLDPWCPNYEHEVWKPFFGERKTAGDKVWWYQCGVPATRLTGTPSDNLPFYWLTAKWNLDGALNYAALSAIKGSSMPVMFRFEHGMDHRMSVDASGRVIPTMRREWEGDGIRDLRLIEWIRGAARRVGAKDAGRAAEILRRLDGVIEAVTPYRIGYSQDPAAWVRAREALYALASETAPGL